MNDLGTLLAWSALQATLLAVAVAVVYPFAARRRPAAGAAVAVVALCGSVVLTLLAVCPLPSWWDWRPPTSPEAARVDPRIAPVPSPASERDSPTAPEDGPSWPVGVVRLTWEGAGRAAAPFADRSQSGWTIVAMFFLVGAAFGLLRLGGGLWAVFDLRRRSRPIIEESTLRLMQQLREEMGCRRYVGLWECSALGAPAAAGWLRPVVLLPADWRDWDADELRAALAHELAHVHRSDYLLGLLARLGLALHFYHPLLYWLAGRLRLQQELAADGLAAPIAGGRDAYLMGLARLALRLSDRRPAGWPANPLFSRGMLMRRIRMLKTKEGRFVGKASPWGRVSVVVLLAAGVVGVAALHCPAQKAGDAAPPLSVVAFVDGGTVEGKDAPAAEPEPFDLPYLPPDTMGVVCFRPSAMLGRPGLKKYADEVNKGIAAYCKALELPRAFGLPVEEIAQVSMTFRVITDKKAKGAQSSLICGAPVLIRAAKDFDWAKEIKTLIPGVKEVHHGDVIYQLPTDGPLAPLSLGSKMCCYVPDSRTIVFDTEERIAQQVERPAKTPAWTADFKRVERDIAAVVLDNRNGAWAHELAARDQPEPYIAPFQDHTSWMVVGVRADEDFAFDVTARFDDEETAETAVKAVEGGLTAARDVLATPEAFRAALKDDVKNATDGPMKNGGRKEHVFFKALVQEPELKRDGASVRLRCRVKGNATEILVAIFEGEIGL